MKEVELEESYDNVASEWLNAVKRGDMRSINMLERQMTFLEKALAEFEV